MYVYKYVMLLDPVKIFVRDRFQGSYYIVLLHLEILYEEVQQEFTIIDHDDPYVIFY